MNKYLHNLIKGKRLAPLISTLYGIIKVPGFSDGLGSIIICKSLNGALFNYSKNGEYFQQTPIVRLSQLFLKNNLFYLPTFP